MAGLDTAVPAEAQGDEQHGGGGAHADAQNGAACGDGIVQTAGDHVGGQREADDQLAQGLDDLGHGGGGHEGMPLEVAAESGQGTHEEHGGSQSHDAVGAVAVVHQGGQLVGKQHHDEHGDDAQGAEGHEGHPEGFGDLIAPAQRVGLGHHLGQSHGETAGGHDDQQGVDIVGGVEVREGRFADDVAQRDLEQGADELDQNDACGQNGGSAEK